MTSVSLLVAHNGPEAHDEGGDGEGEEVMGDGVEVAAAYEDGADAVDEVVHGVDIGGEISPVGHGAHGGEQSA